MNSGVINDENYNFTSKEGLLEKLVKATYNGDGVFTKVDNIKAAALRLETYLDSYDGNSLVTYIDNDLEKTKQILLHDLR